MPSVNCQLSTVNCRVKPKGFTLIELLIVISIIGILAGLTLASYNNSQSKARDAQRKTDLKDLQKALQQYYQDNSQYPFTANVCCLWYSSEPDETRVSNNGGDWIPGLSPNYIVKLPRDPKGGPGGVNLHPDCPNWKRGYLYASNGTNYKLLSSCAPEGQVSSSDPFYDPTRSTWAWQISTKGGYNW